MPTISSIPSVYVDENPGGHRPIEGAPTSLAGFVGRARRGPTDRAVAIGSFAEFERAFGGLWSESSMSYAVQDFFRNGGSRAVIVRLFRATMAADAEGAVAVAAAQPVKAMAPRARARITHETLDLEAASEGAWGSALRVRVERDSTPGAPAHRFDLLVKDMGTGQSEVHRSVSISTADTRRVDVVLASASALLRVHGALPPGLLIAPAPSGPVAPGRDDPFTDPSSTSVLPEDASDDGLVPAPSDYIGSALDRSGIHRLADADQVNLVCIPPPTIAGETHERVWAEAIAFCESRRAILIIDPPVEWGTPEAALAGIASGAGIGPRSANAAVYFPRLRHADPLREDHVGEFVSCGAVAGVIARIDSSRGVWKAPAGLHARLSGMVSLAVPLTDAENDGLNRLGLNCLRAFPDTGCAVWGARTRLGQDDAGSDWKYLPVRRTALFIEESIDRGTKWVVFEPSDERVWSRIRHDVEVFMLHLFRLGAFAGTTPREAFFVKCDRETMTQRDVDQGIVNILIGFAALKPAEFVVIRVQQIAGGCPGG